MVKLSTRLQKVLVGPHSSAQSCDAGSMAKDQESRGENIQEAKLFSKSELKNMNESDFMNERAYLAVRDWLENKKQDLNLLKFLSK